MTKRDRYGEPIFADAQILQFRPRRAPGASTPLRFADRASARRHLAEARTVLELVSTGPTPASVEPMQIHLSTTVDDRKDHRHATGA